ncbi:zinc-binding dehydrogenase [Xylariaceae sp. FL0804]|nr:zinc-binding dehydrogenase [Xylariaceae sp. FL0804]
MSRVVSIKHVPGKPGQVYYPLELGWRDKPTPGPGELLLRMHAAALNHRDLFTRQGLYPGIAFGRPLLADGCGTVVAVGPQCSAASRELLGRLVVPTPSRGWEAAPEGPEEGRGPWAVLGGTQAYDAGTAQDYYVVPEAEVEPAPPHLGAVEAACLPLVGLTAWRALVTKTGEGNAAPGRNILVTGIGGGVALAALQFAVALGCNVFVTSGSRDKIERAARLGARGGVVYRDADWDKQLRKLLPPERPFLDAVVDGAGGDVVARSVRLLKPGGVISQYGMTTGPKMDWSMAAVLKNVELRGSTMGSRREFADMMAFARERQIRPVVSRVAGGGGGQGGKEGGLHDRAALEGLFDDMRDARQFGKLVVEISPEAEGAREAGEWRAAAGHADDRAKL